MKSRTYLEIAMLGSLLWFAGCTPGYVDIYGESEGMAGRASPSGVTIFRNIVSDQNRHTWSVRKLTPKGKRVMHGLVWVPDTFRPHELDTLKWIDEWLASGDRTLIYVGRDFAPSAEYWRQVSERAIVEPTEIPAKNRMYPLDYGALEEIKLDIRRGQEASRVSNPWVRFSYSGDNLTATKQLEGEWADDLEADKARVFNHATCPVWSQRELKNLEKEMKDEIEKAKVSGTSTTVTPPVVGPTPTGTSSSRNSNRKSNRRNNRFIFSPEIVTPEDDLQLIQYGLTLDRPKYEVLLSSDDEPLIVSLTSPRWPNSKLVCVANASLISNISLTNSENRKIATKLAGLLQQDIVGFIAGSADPQIQDTDAASQQKGFELLTVWPVNLISIHALFMGLIALFAGYPIFGRPRRLRERTTTDFGQHIQALGDLLGRSRDKFFALTTISEYFRSVRKDTISPWANAIDMLAPQERAAEPAVEKPPMVAPKPGPPAMGPPAIPTVSHSPQKSSLPPPPPPQAKDAGKP